MTQTHARSRLVPVCSPAALLTAGLHVAGGRVTDRPQLLRGSGYPRLDSAALDWALQGLQFLPATRDGLPVAGCKGFRLQFRITPQARRHPRRWSMVRHLRGFAPERHADRVDDAGPAVPATNNGDSRLITASLPGDFPGHSSCCRGNARDCRQDRPR